MGMSAFTGVIRQSGNRQGENGQGENGQGERGFTLMEILLAMTILVLGGVSVISLFAAAVSLQYDSVVNERKAMILSDIVSEAQQVLNDHKPTKEAPTPASNLVGPLVVTAHSITDSGV